MIRMLNLIKAKLITYVITLLILLLQDVSKKTSLINIIFIVTIHPIPS